MKSLKNHIKDQRVAQATVKSNAMRASKRNALRAALELKEGVHDEELKLTLMEDDEGFLLEYCDKKHPSVKYKIVVTQTGYDADTFSEDPKRNLDLDETLKEIASWFLKTEVAHL